MTDNFSSIDDELKAVEKLIADQRIKRIKKKSNKRHLISPYKYLIVVDFEATCFEKPHSRKIQEIIEFPAVLFNLESGLVEAEFHKYLKPVEDPVLSDYCTNLTGITQETVDEGSSLADVLEDFKVWLKKVLKEKNLILPKTKKSNLEGNCALVTWGNWDFNIQLKYECNRKKIRRPPFFNQWIDLKEIYSEKGTFKDSFSFADALAQSGITFVGRPHNGLDDARNTAMLAYKMHKEGSFLRLTKDLNLHELNRSF
ncbi:CLUMA_CG010613, isoform A [Clunio marinus]|uniref:CLUMA_CG010613, isoform A n=1 Tax=Clunio marinus TaxID=568069 RepID=A0A1J1IAD2_9DIPT|nr:CLUMA_CG010613, isoform A [Clunio marinus]